MKKIIFVLTLLIITAVGTAASAQNCANVTEFTVTKLGEPYGENSYLLHLKWDSKGLNKKTITLTLQAGFTATLDIDATVSDSYDLFFNYPGGPASLTVTSSSAGKDGLKLECWRDTWFSTSMVE